VTQQRLILIILAVAILAIVGAWLVAGSQFGTRQPPQN